MIFPATTGPGAAYGLDGVTATARSHAYTFTAASGFSGTVPVTATDRATNGSVRTFTVERDATPPQVWVSAPAGIIGGAFTVTWGAVDAQAGVAWYDLDVSVDGGPWQRVLTRTLSTTYQQTNQPANYYTFRLTATDHVSNAASALARTSVVRVTKYYYHGGARVALRTTGAGGGVVYWLHGDHLGSVSLVTDASGQVVARQLYQPYGTVRYTEGTFPTDFGFTGQRAVAGTGLIFMHARFYHPALGRFTQADTIVPNWADPQALNKYSYVYNRPLVFHDPDGHIAILATMGIGALIGGIALGVTYAVTTDEFDWGECLTAAAVGAVAGALIGSGVGAIQGAAMIAAGGAAVASTTPIAATIAIGAGTGIAASGGGYIVANRVTGESFDTRDFLVTSGVGAVEGGISAIPGVGVGGRVAVSGVAGVAESALSDRVHGRNVDWGRAASAGAIGLAAGGAGEAFRSGVDLVTGRAIASPGLSLGPPVPEVNMTQVAVQQLSSYQGVTRQATKTTQYQTARVVVRTVVRDTAFEAGKNIIGHRRR